MREICEREKEKLDDELMNFIRENICKFGQKKAVQLSDSEIVVSSSSEPSLRGIS